MHADLLHHTHLVHTSLAHLHTGMVDTLLRTQRKSHSMQVMTELLIERGGWTGLDRCALKSRLAPNRRQDGGQRRHSLHSWRLSFSRRLTDGTTRRLHAGALVGRSIVRS